MEEPSLIALAVEGACTYAGSGRHAHHHIGIFLPAVVQFGQVVHDLVEADCHKISELHFHHGLHAFDREAKRGTHNRGFAERGVAYPVLAKGFNKSFGHFEHPAVFGDVLAHEHQVVVRLHGLAQSVLDRVDHAHVLGRCDR